jgi:hypothetical protein
VGWLDGTRTVREAAQAFAASAGLPLDELRPGLPNLVRRLLHLGLLRPAAGD